MKTFSKSVRGQKLLYCNIIVTARPHSTKEIERYFGMVVRTNGFNREQAEKFASSIPVDRRKVGAVLQYSPSGWEYLYVLSNHFSDCLRACEK